MNNTQIHAARTQSVQKRVTHVRLTIKYISQQVTVKMQYNYKIKNMLNPIEDKDTVITQAYSSQSTAKHYVR